VLDVIDVLLQMLFQPWHLQIQEDIRTEIMPNITGIVVDIVAVTNKHKQ
jgi:hypothetical protein